MGRNGAEMGMAGASRASARGSLASDGRGRAILAVLGAVTVVGGCSPATDGAEPVATPSISSASASPAPGLTVLEVTSSDPTDEERTSQPSPAQGTRGPGGATHMATPTDATERRQEPTDGVEDSGRASFADVWRRRDELVGQTIVVEGRVLFDLVCPPQAEPRDSTCVASAKLVDPSIEHLADAGAVLPLARDGASISCEAQTSTGLVCQGLQDGLITTIRGVVRRVTGLGVVIDDAATTAA